MIGIKCISKTFGLYIYVIMNNLNVLIFYTIFNNSYANVNSSFEMYQKVLVIKINEFKVEMKT